MQITVDLLLSSLKDLSESGLTQILFWVMMLDILSGYTKAFKTKRFDSKVGTNGILRHTLVFATMVLVGTYARALGYDEISVSLCLFFIFNYSISLLENYEAIGLPFPSSLKPIFSQMQKQKDESFKKVMHVEKMEVEELDEEEGGE